MKRLVSLLKERFSPLILRIMGINLVCLLILSVFNYIAFYNSNNKAFVKNVTNYNQSVTEIAFRNIDQQIIQKAAGIPTLFFSDIWTNEALIMPQKRDISNSPADVLALSSKINGMLAAYPMVHSINVYYEATNSIITGRGNLHFALDEEERNRYLPWYRSFEDSDKNVVFTDLNNLVYPIQLYANPEQSNGSEQVVSIITRIKNPKWHGKNVVVAVHIPTRNFSEYIDEQQGTFIIVDQSGDIIYSTHNSGQDAAGIVAAAMGLPSGTSRLNKQELVISRSTKDFLGLTYLYALPYTVFFKDYTSYLQTLFINYFLSVLVIMVMLLVVSYMSNTAYRKRLLSLSKKAGLAMSDRPDTFEQSIDELSGQLSSMNTAILQSRPMLYRNYVRSLILGRQAGAAYEQLNPLFCRFLGVFCIIVNLTPADATKLDLDTMSNTLQGEDQSCNILLTTLEQTQIAVVVCTDTDGIEAVRQRLIQCLDTMFEGYYAADGQWFGLGESGEQSFKMAYNSAINISRYHFIFPTKTYLRYEKIGPVQIKNSGSHMKLFAEIEKDIMSEDLLDLKQRLYALAESFKYGSYSIDYCSSTLRDLVTMLYNIIQSRQLDMWLTLGYDIRAHYKQIGDIDEFYSWSSELCEILMQNLRQRKKGMDVDLHSRVIQLIEENLENDISLEFLADHLGLRPDVLSRTFKQLVGKSYIDYVKDKKLNRARQLIAEGYSMKDISLRLGYNSTQYFIKIFKESYGVTPYQYKKHGMPE